MVFKVSQVVALVLRYVLNHRHCGNFFFLATVDAIIVVQSQHWFWFVSVSSLWVMYCPCSTRVFCAWVEAANYART